MDASGAKGGSNGSVPSDCVRPRLAKSAPEQINCRRRWNIAMPTSKEYRHRAEECLRLANETKKIFARMALLELVAEFRAMAQQLELRERRNTKQRFSLLRTRHPSFDHLVSAREQRRWHREAERLGGGHPPLLLQHLEHGFHTPALLGKS